MRAQAAATLAAAGHPDHEGGPAAGLQRFSKDLQHHVHKMAGAAARAHKACTATVAAHAASVNAETPTEAEEQCVTLAATHSNTLTLICTGNVCHTIFHYL